VFEHTFRTQAVLHLPLEPFVSVAELTETGLGDVQAELNWVWREETARRPALFSFLEVAFPFQKEKKLIGTSDWEFKLGAGVIRGFSWGTATFRAAMEYEAAENAFGVGEVAGRQLPAPEGRRPSNDRRLDR